MKEETTKRVLNHNDIAGIYGVGQAASYRIIREIRAMYPNEKHPLPAGKVFASDLPMYEERMRGNK